MGNFKPGHLNKNDESKINNVSVINGQVIYSENSGMQFVDYDDKRHTYGNVLTGIYNDTGYVDFTTSDLDTILESIKSNSFVNDGQFIKTANSIYKYRKIGDKNFIIKLDDHNIDVFGSKVGFVIYMPEYVTGDLVNMDLLISINNETNPDKLFFIKVTNNEIDLSACMDIDGVFDSNTFNISISHDGNGLFRISPNIAGLLDIISYNIISYSVSSSGYSTNEGLYVVTSDL